MSETINGLNGYMLCAICCAWFMVGVYVGTWIQERWGGGDDANDGTGDEP